MRMLMKYIQHSIHAFPASIGKFTSKGEGKLSTNRGESLHDREGEFSTIGGESFHDKKKLSTI
jgi:hypothetical protein